MGINAVNLALSKSYTKKTAEGAGALKGEDGFSPVVSIRKTDDGTEVSITDLTHTETFEIKNGKGVPEGGKDGQVLTKTGESAEWKDQKGADFPDFIQCVL